MIKTTAYLDSNFFSILHYSGGHVSSLSQHIATREWWALERRHFVLFTSRWTVEELEQGIYECQKEAVAEAKRTRFLANTGRVKECAATFIQTGIVPSSKFGDAIQLALATAHEVDYLVTWNHAHLANAYVQWQLERLNNKKGWRTPLLVSPNTIPWVSLGHSVRRKDGR